MKDRKPVMGYNPDLEARRMAQNASDPAFFRDVEEPADKVVLEGIRAKKKEKPKNNKGKREQD